MPTVFTKIIEGEIAGTFVWRDDRRVAFMSIDPLRPGHVLLVPRDGVDHWLDCPDDLQDHLMRVAREIGQAIQSVYRPTRVGLMIAWLEVPHLHIHLVPIDSVGNLDFSNAAASVESNELEAAADSIRGELARRGADGASR